MDLAPGVRQPVVVEDFDPRYDPFGKWLLELSCFPVAGCVLDAGCPGLGKDPTEGGF